MQKWRQTATESSDRPRLPALIPLTSTILTPRTSSPVLESMTMRTMQSKKNYPSTVLLIPSFLFSWDQRHGTPYWFPACLCCLLCSMCMVSLWYILWHYSILAHMSQLTNKWSDSSDMFAHREQLKATVQEILFSHYQDTWLQLKKQVFSFCQNSGRHFWRCGYISYMATMAYYKASERTYRILSRITVLTSCTRVMTYPFGRSLLHCSGKPLTRNLSKRGTFRHVRSPYIYRAYNTLYVYIHI